MAALADHSNVYNTALLILQRKGYQLWKESHGTGRRRYELYGAEKDGWDFLANSPLALLGAVAIFEEKRPTSCTDYWWREEGSQLYHHLPDSPRPYKPIWRKR